MIITKAFRIIIRIKEKVFSRIRVFLLKLQYPSLSIEGSYIGKDCTIVIVDGAEVILKNAYIHDGVNIKAECGSKLVILNSYIGFNSVIVSYASIVISENCEIAEMVVIRDQDHDFSSGNLIKTSGYKSEPITIGKNVWIGTKATILKGVELGENSVVGANAVVTKSFPAESVVAGVPAKIIKVLK